MVDMFEGLRKQGEMNRILGGASDEMLDKEVVARWLTRPEEMRCGLEEIGEGTYDVCDATREQIPKDQLEAAPEAVYTIESQQTLERKT